MLCSRHLLRSEVTTDACHRLPLIIAFPLLSFQSKAFKQLRDASIKCLAGEAIDHLSVTYLDISTANPFQDHDLLVHVSLENDALLLPDSIFPGLPAHLAMSHLHPFAMSIHMHAPSRTCFAAKSVRDPRNTKLQGT